MPFPLKILISTIKQNKTQSLNTFMSILKKAQKLPSLGEQGPENQLSF